MREFKIRFAAFVVVFMLIFASGAALADVTDPISTMEFLQLLISSVGGMKGASAMVVATTITQLAMAFFRTDMALFAGKWKLLIVTFLSIVSGVLGLLMTGVPVSVALLHASTLTAMQVFAHQIVKQFLLDDKGQIKK